MDKLSCEQLRTEFNRRSTKDELKEKLGCKCGNCGSEDGIEAVIAFCELSAFKYNFRRGRKPLEPDDRDYQKEQWYRNKAKELRERKGR